MAIATVMFVSVNAQVADLKPARAPSQWNSADVQQNVEAVNEIAKEYGVSFPMEWNYEAFVSESRESDEMLSSNLLKNKKHPSEWSIEKRDETFEWADTQFDRLISECGELSQNYYQGDAGIKEKAESMALLAGYFANLTSLLR